MTAPNTRVQRTRSSPSAPHSPLTRHPLGATWQRFALLAVVVSVAAACARGESSAAAAVRNIRKTDISWEGNFVGLSPQVAGAASLEVLRVGRRAVPQLVVALDDPERFAAAHVLLTQIQMAGASFPVSSAQWNRLTVDLSADGTARLHPEQREELKAFWRSRLSGA